MTTKGRGNTRDYKVELEMASKIAIEWNSNKSFNIIDNVVTNWGIADRDARDVKTVVEKAFNSNGELILSEFAYCNNMGNLAILLRNFTVEEIQQLVKCGKMTWGISQAKIKANKDSWRRFLDGNEMDTTPCILRLIDAETDFVDFDEKWEIDKIMSTNDELFVNILGDYTYRDMVVFGSPKWDEMAKKVIQVMFDMQGNATITGINFDNGESYMMKVNRVMEITLEDTLDDVWIIE